MLPRVITMPKTLFRLADHVLLGVLDALLTATGDARRRDRGKYYGVHYYGDE